MMKISVSPEKEEIGFFSIFSQELKVFPNLFPCVYFKVQLPRESSFSFKKTMTDLHFGIRVQNEYEYEYKMIAFSHMMSILKV